MTNEQFAKHIQRNWNKDKDRGLYLNKILIKPNKRITPEKIYDDLD